MEVVCDREGVDSYSERYRVQGLSWARDAFNAMRRQLEDYARRRRGDQRILAAGDRERAPGGDPDLPREGGEGDQEAVGAVGQRLAGEGAARGERQRLGQPEFQRSLPLQVVVAETLLPLREIEPAEAEQPLHVDPRGTIRIPDRCG